MIDEICAIETWIAKGSRCALATVTQTWGSSPRPAGSSMAIREDGAVVGSVSGGCVEGAVIEAARSSIRDGKAAVLEFGSIEPEAVWAVGLSCGGSIRVLVEPIPDGGEHPDGLATWQEIANRLRDRTPFVAVVRLESGRVERALLDPETGEGGVGLPAEVRASALEHYEKRESGEAELAGETYFFHVHARPDRLLIVGGSHIAIPLVAFARELGFETLVVEPRAAFAGADRFPAAPERILNAWPGEALPSIGLDEDTYAVVLTHDPKIDDEALRILLKSPAAYIGALGSRTTHADRRQRLLAEGFSEAELGRIHGPIGLDIGARTPEEIALSIIAEIVKVRRGKE